MLISRNIIGYLAAIENVLEAELLNLLLYLVYVEILYFGTFFQCFIFLDVLHFFYIILFRFFLLDIRFNINVFFSTKFTLEFLLSIKKWKIELKMKFKIYIYWVFMAMIKLSMINKNVAI